MLMTKEPSSPGQIYRHRNHAPAAETKWHEYRVICVVLHSGPGLEDSA